ncbi:MAG TPA: hypothetical protein VG123_24585, partial [Streptosporangiaceae bacterium]|nr:hypothetical protein [Streptosporangiaceae bacterium]
MASHPDAEGELVLAALGGEKARCIEVAEAWARHTDDLSVLAIGPRHAGDEIAVGWDDVIAAAQAGQAPSVTVGSGRMKPAAMRLASQPGPTMARMAARQRQAQEETLAAQRRRNDILSLLALGYGFQVRLIGQVAAAHAGRDGGSAGHGGTTPLAPPARAGHGGTTPLAPPAGQVRPALVAAIAGRLGPVAEEWLGIDPDQVTVSLH